MKHDNHGINHFVRHFRLLIFIFIYFYFFFVPGTYLYTKGSLPRKPGDKARLVSPTLWRLRGDHCLTFYYNMHGMSTGTLRILIDNLSTVVWEFKGDQGTGWRKAQIPYDPSELYNVGQHANKIKKLNTV